MPTRRRAFVKRVRLIALAAISVGLASGVAGGAFASFTAPSESYGNRIIAADVVPPTAVSATGQAGGVAHITWTATATTFVTGYSIYRSATSGGPWTLAGTVSGRSTVQFDDTPGLGDWYYVVRATYQNWVSANSNQAGAVSVLGPPTGVGAALQSDGRTARITWTATASTAATGYAIYRGTSASGPWSLAGSVSGRSTVTYDDVPPADGTYFYVVRATVGSTESGNSTASSSVTSLALDHFTFSTIGPDQDSTRAFSVTITAKSASNATVAGFTQAATLSTNNGATISPTTTGAFSGGSKTVSVTLTGSYSASQTITATALSKSTASNTFTLHDWVFPFKTTTGNTGTGCYASVLAQRDMDEGYLGAGADETMFRQGGTGSITFCGSPFTASRVVPATSATAHLWVENASGSNCTITGYLAKNDTVQLGTGTLVVAGGASLAERTLTLTNTGSTFAAGDRIDLILAWQSVKACDKTTLYYGSAAHLSRLVMPIP